MRAPPGRLWPKSEDAPLWSDNPHPGILLRRAKLDEKGEPIPGSERVTPMPLDRTMEAAFAWAEKEYS